MVQTMPDVAAQSDEAQIRQRERWIQSDQRDIEDINDKLELLHAWQRDLQHKIERDTGTYPGSTSRDRVLRCIQDAAQKIADYQRKLEEKEYFIHINQEALAALQKRVVEDPIVTYDPTPTDAQIKQFFDLLNTGIIDRHIMQEMLLLCSRDRWIDLDAQPFIPEGWSIGPEDQIASRATGMWRFDPAQIRLYRSDKQEACRDFIDLLCEPRLNQSMIDSALPVLPANVLDWLLDDHQELIPKNWATGHKSILFWGTVYKNNYGRLTIRRLYVDYCPCSSRAIWQETSAQIDNYFSNVDHSAVLV